MNSLIDISGEAVRKNWQSSKDIIADSPYYDILWKSFENKFNISTEDNFYIILKKFINNEDISYKKPLYDRIHIIKENDSTLVFKGLGGDERREIHQLCDKIGLHHESKIHSKKKHKKNLYIYKPHVWLWEFTEKNPYSKSETYYKQRELERLERQKIEEEKMKRRYCSICEKNGLETDLFHSVYIRGIYCNDCLEFESDGTGGTLSDHKFEPFY